MQPSEPQPDITKPPAPTAQQKPPPGWVIGPDGKPCKICTAFRNWPRNVRASKVAGSSSESSGSTSAVAATAAATAVAAATSTDVTPTRPENCPPDVEVLGRATWTFLHTTAAYYPEKPTPAQRVNMLNLIRSLPMLYPCSHCASDFEERVKEHPPNVSGRLALSKWLCERHNDVNEKLGKEKFSCTIGKLDERWKDGPSDGSCD